MPTKEASVERAFLEAASLSPARRYLDWISIFSEMRRAALYTDEFLSQLSEDPFDFLGVDGIGK